MSDPIKAAFGRVARPQSKIEAQALFHACFFHNLGIRKSAEALTANHLVYLLVSTGKPTAPLYCARGLLSSTCGLSCPYDRLNRG